MDQKLFFCAILLVTGTVAGPTFAQDSALIGGGSHDPAMIGDQRRVVPNAPVQSESPDYNSESGEEESTYEDDISDSKDLLQQIERRLDEPLSSTNAAEDYSNAEAIRSEAGAIVFANWETISNETQSTYLRVYQDSSPDSPANGLMASVKMIGKRDAATALAGVEDLLQQLVKDLQRGLNNNQQQRTRNR